MGNRLKVRTAGGASPGGSAQPHRLDVRDRGRGYLAHHSEVALASLRRLLAEPLATLMTLTVMAIALTLPAVLYVGLQNAQGLSEQWRGADQLSLFLERSLSEEQGRDLAAQLAENSQIATTSYLSKAAALDEFKRYSGLGDTLAVLDQNPLPAVILLNPAPGYGQAAQLQTLAEQLGAVDGVAEVVMDMVWIERLRAMVGFAQRAVLVLGGLLGLGVLLVVGNTIRLEIENRRDEIQVVKLVGATDAFVRRPFLYTGFWYGAGAGLLAWLVVQLILLYLGATLGELIGLYPGSFQLAGLSAAASGSLLLAGLLLGVAGAWVAVVRHLTDIEPR